jgi:hypothetical protein
VKKAKKAGKVMTEEEELELERKIENRQWQREQQQAMRAAGTTFQHCNDFPSMFYTLTITCRTCAERDQTKEGSKYDRERAYDKRARAKEQRQRNTREGGDDDSDEDEGRAWDDVITKPRNPPLPVSSGWMLTACM